MSKHLSLPLFPETVAPYLKAVTKNRNSAVEKKLAHCKQELATVQYKIDHLQKHYSIMQIRAWKAYRKKLRAQIKFLEQHISIILKHRYETQVQNHAIQPKGSMRGGNDSHQHVNIISPPNEATQRRKAIHGYFDEIPTSQNGL